MQGADAEQATKQRGKSKVEFGIARLICVKQKETLVLRETCLCTANFAQGAFER